VVILVLFKIYNLVKIVGYNVHLNLKKLQIIFNYSLVIDVLVYTYTNKLYDEKNIKKKTI